MVFIFLLIWNLKKRTNGFQTSQSHAAQEQLAKLEKASAPFGEQLLEAAKFIGVNIDTVGRCAKIEEGEEKKGKAAVYHGREEWLLRWLLKKLQIPKDAMPRYVFWRIQWHWLIDRADKHHLLGGCSAI